MCGTYAQDGFWFSYGGGQYIDVHIDGEPVPFEVINVIDQEGKKTIKPGRKGFEARCKKWIKELNRDILSGGM